MVHLRTDHHLPLQLILVWQTRPAVEVTEGAMLVVGGGAYAKVNQLERYLRDARTSSVRIPQDDLTKLALGKVHLEQ